MKTKKLIPFIAVVCTIIILALTLVGCNTPMSKEDTYNAIKEAINNSNQTVEVYNTVIWTKNNNTQKTIYQYIADDKETEKNDTRAKFITTNQKGLYGEEVKNYYEFGYSKSEKISDKEAKPEDYKPYEFTTIGKNSTVPTPSTFETYESKEISGIYNPLTNKLDSTMKISDFKCETLLSELAKIQLENISDNKFSSYKKGVSIITSFTITNLKDCIYNNLTLEITISYNKIARIVYTTSDKANITMNFVYASPKINTPSYDAKF